MPRTHTLLVAFLAAALFIAMSPVAAFAQDPTYISNSQCKICHNKKDEGEQWNIWKAEKHSKAFELLSTDEAKAVAAKAGLTTPPAESPECLTCHVTSFDTATGKAAEKIKMEDGVQCESCHGPGSEHAALGKKFKSGDKTVNPADKMPHPGESACVKCHNDKSPTWKTDRYTLADGTTVGFDYAQAWEKIKHNKPAKN